MLTFNEESNPRHQSTGSRHQRCAPEPDEPDAAASTVAAAALGVPAAALSPAEVEKRCALGGGGINQAVLQSHTRRKTTHVSVPNSGLIKPRRNCLPGWGGVGRVGGT